ncbi:MAG: fucose isomerase [candidate division WOR-3 bacterium]
MENVPKINLGIIAVSRDCFPIELSQRRREAVLGECLKKKIPITKIETIIETEKDVLKALKEIKEKEINALIIYLGNFGPEGPTTLLAQKFSGPVMFVGAGEEDGANLIHGRGDAYCGLLSASYNLGLRHIKAYIPEYPVGLPSEIADMIKDFIPIARILLGIKKLKIFSFGPRPQDFITCNAPIKPLYDLGVEIMENSELDLYDIYLKEKNNPEVKEVVQDMEKEIGKGNTYPELLPKLAQYEVALKKFREKNLGASEFGVFANKCWPSFERYFGFVPCYVNSRLAKIGIPVSCEVDIYGVLSQYIVTCASELPSTILDINNTVPPDIYKKSKNKIGRYKLKDLFMGFHCGNTPSSCLISSKIKYQLIMNRLMEPGKEPEITRGTLEGRIKPGDITIFRLQSKPDTTLLCYVAEGEILDVDPKTFGGVGIFAIKEMGRFYRHVLIGKKFPHHTTIAFKHIGKTLFDAMKVLGIEDVSFNHPSGMLYPDEAPF